MPTSAPIEFEAHFTPELLDDGARAFVRQFLFRRYGPWLAFACALNLAGFAFAFSLGVTGLPLAFAGVLAVAGPAYLAWAYTSYSSRIAKRMQLHWLPSAHFAFGDAELGMRIASGSASIPWGRVRAWLDSPSCLVLVLSPIAFAVLPKTSLPAQAQDVVSAKVPRYVV